MGAAHGKRIIIVEGAAGDAASAADCLRLGGHQVDVAPHLRAARDRLAAQQADLLLCDAGSMLAVLPSPKDRTAAWRAALAGLAYELRNLLDTLSESIDELCQLTSATPFVGRAEALARGRRRIARIQGVIDDLLAQVGTGAAQELRVQEANLEDLVEGAAIAVYGEACRKNQRLIINIEQEASRVRADRAKLKRLLANLLESAVRHAPVAGTVAVEARRENSDCLIAVSDSGEDTSPGAVGDAAPTAPTDDGARRRPARSRLSVVKALVELHGGRVWVESHPGRGTTVFVSLPQPATPQEEAWAGGYGAG